MLEVLAPFNAPARLLHVAAGVMLIAGLVGRWTTLAHAERAARASDISAVQALLRTSHVFEKMVIISSQIVIVLGLLTAWGMGYPILGFLQGNTTNWLLVSLVLYASIIGLVPTVFVPKGRRFEAALQQSIKVGQPTPALVSAFADRVVRGAHIYEVGIVGVVLALMVLKPF
ncbi:MAG: DUF2269 family protein [Chloroflexota bacterium]|nr:DUF2269 family protein [Chloroflexota bacterium]